MPEQPAIEQRNLKVRMPIERSAELERSAMALQQGMPEHVEVVSLVRQFKHGYAEVLLKVDAPLADFIAFAMEGSRSLAALPSAVGRIQPPAGISPAQEMKHPTVRVDLAATPNRPASSSAGSTQAASSRSNNEEVPDLLNLPAAPAPPGCDGKLEPCPGAKGRRSSARVSFNPEQVEKLPAIGIGRKVVLPGKTLIHIDGSASPDGRAGAGVRLDWPSSAAEEHAQPADVAGASNNTAELSAALLGLRIFALGDPSLADGAVTQEVEIITDSSLVQRGATEWLEGWKESGWLKANSTPPAHVEHWKALHKQIELLQRAGINICWSQVKGHQGHGGNMRADRLASQARKASAAR